MRKPIILLAALGAALALASPARAFTCYMLYDRNDNLVYRDTLSPVDMSDQGDAAREAMRREGEYLIVADADRCPQVRFVFGSAGSKTLSVDTVVNGLPAGAAAAAKTTPRRRARQ
ncbi:MAG TPA: hypothetical protein VJQ49_01705 [Casimicrobiaceae bacterium]|nr:hypothetical protein [Casimicrobiaceae bacterium]